jgi:hypothetical protein
MSLIISPGVGFAFKKTSAECLDTAAALARDLVVLNGKKNINHPHIGITNNFMYPPRLFSMK